MTNKDKAVITRLRRKFDIMRLDAKSRGDVSTQGDIYECIALLDILERDDDTAS